MNDKLTGGCACGAIRFECDKPLRMLQCHCVDCQKISGSAFMPVVVVPKPGFRITKGEPTWFDHARQRGGINRRGFCPTCGSRLFSAGDDLVQGIAAGGFDDRSWFKPRGNAFVSHAQPWDVMDPSVPIHDAYLPTRETDRA